MTSSQSLAQLAITLKAQGKPVAAGYAWELAKMNLRIGK